MGTCIFTTGILGKKFVNNNWAYDLSSNIIMTMFSYALKIAVQKTIDKLIISCSENSPFTCWCLLEFDL